MSIPKNIHHAVIAIWGTIAITAISAVIEKQMGAIDSGTFNGYLFFYGLFCIIPYKISKGSNPARYVFTIVMIIGYLLMLGGETDDMSKLDLVLSKLLIPVYIFIVYRLFSGDANNWFSQSM